MKSNLKNVMNRNKVVIVKGTKKLENGEKHKFIKCVQVGCNAKMMPGFPEVVLPN